MTSTSVKVDLQIHLLLRWGAELVPGSSFHTFPVLRGPTPPCRLHLNTDKKTKKKAELRAQIGRFEACKASVKCIRTKGGNKAAAPEGPIRDLRGRDGRTEGRRDGEIPEDERFTAISGGREGRRTASIWSAYFDRKWGRNIQVFEFLDQCVFRHVLLLLSVFWGFGWLCGIHPNCVCVCESALLWHNEERRVKCRIAFQHALETSVWKEYSVGVSK